MKKSLQANSFSYDKNLHNFLSYKTLREDAQRRVNVDVAKQPRLARESVKTDSYF